MKKIILSILVACAMPALSASAQALSSLLIPSAPEYAAMGGASVALEAGAFAAENNAAAMSLSDDSFAVAAGYGLWAPETAGSQLAGLGAFARVGERGWNRLQRPLHHGEAHEHQLRGRRNPRHFHPLGARANLAVSVKVIDGLSVGVTGKFVRSSIGEKLSGSAFGADVSVAWRKDGLSAGAAVCNLGSKVKYGDSSYSMPMLVKAGAAYSADFGLTASVEADYLFSGAFAAGLGLEYNLFDIGFLRAGYHYGDKSQGLASFASLGAGVQFAGVELSAAWLTASPPSATPCSSASATASKLSVGLDLKSSPTKHNKVGRDLKSRPTFFMPRRSRGRESRK